MFPAGIAAVDAMGCQKAAARDITAEHGGYTPALKENHPEGYAEARELIEGIDDPSCSFLRHTEATRDRGRIENKPHWVPDAVFREDYARNRKDRSAADPAVVRKITLNLLRLEPAENCRARKFSLNRKRLYASYEPDFLLKILFNL
jgi:predicted transposase YbfD/YdcC